MKRSEPRAGQDDSRLEPATGSRVLARVSQRISPWLELETVTAAMPGADAPEIYHGLKQADYVNVFCLHRNGNVVLVRQYRPVLDVWTLEFPGGLRDDGESPATTAAREVHEETGLSVIELVPLLETYADVGRLSNRFYGSFALVAGELHQHEASVEALFVSGEELSGLAATGKLAIPGNIGLLYLAGLNARVREICTALGHDGPPWMALAGGQAH
jgi:ADP-ribose pyrophosphatase